jgi:hypothetical protein
MNYKNWAYGPISAEVFLKKMIEEIGKMNKF